MSQHMEFHRSFVRLSDVISAIRHAEHNDKTNMDLETDFSLNLNFQIYLSDSGLALLDCTQRNRGMNSFGGVILYVRL